MSGWKDEPWLVIDTETTGLDIDSRHVVELGACTMQGGEMKQARSWLVRPPEPIPEESTAIHGITDEMVADAPTIEDTAAVLLGLVDAHAVIVGYNGYSSDLPLLKRLIPDEGGGSGFREACRGKTILDPLVLVRFDDVGRYWRGKGRHRLTEAYKRSGFDPIDGAHRTDADCLMTGRILWEWRRRLPDDGRAAQRMLARQKQRQDEAFAAWLATQPPRED